MLREARQHGGLGRMQPPQHSPGDEQHERRQWQPDCHPGHKGNWHTCLLGDQCGTDQVRRRADDCRHPASRGSIGQHQHQANSELSKLVRRSPMNRRQQAQRDRQHEGGGRGVADPHGDKGGHDPDCEKNSTRMDPHPSKR